MAMDQTTLVCTAFFKNLINPQSYLLRHVCLSTSAYYKILVTSLENDFSTGRKLIKTFCTDLELDV